MRVDVPDVQRRRAGIVEAMVELSSERGFAGASVARVCARARVSGAVFYEMFPGGREACFLAALDQGHRRASSTVAEAFEHADSWLEGTRGALAGLLLLFDAEPALARVCVVESLAAGPWALERREQHVATLLRQILSCWGVHAPSEPHRFAGEGVMASVLNVIQNHMLGDGQGPLSALLGPLMGLATAPYLDARDVAEEVERSAALARELQTANAAAPIRGAGDGWAELPGPLRNPRAHRLRECVLYLTEHPAASNRQIAQAVGIARDTQISTVLARLDRLGLLSKHTGGPGGPNAWTLTAHGTAAARTLRASNTENVTGALDLAGTSPARSMLDTGALQPSVIEKDA